MNTFKAVSVFGLATLLFPFQSSFGASQLNLEAYFETKVFHFEDQLLALDDASSSTPASSMVLSDINVQVSSALSIGIDSVLNLTITPEIDFIVTPAVSP